MVDDAQRDRLVKPRLGPDDLVIDSGMMQAVPFPERVAAAAAAGFTAISMWGRDRSDAHAAGLSDEDMRRVLDDHGMAVADLSALATWLPGTETVGGGVFGDGHPFFGWSERDFFETGEAVKARSLSLIDIAGLHVGVDFSLDEAAEAFAGMCDRAAEHGLLVQIEFMALSSLPALADAWAVVEAAGRQNGGIVLDSWHFFRTGTLDDLSAVPAERIFGLQISDALRQRHPDPVHDAGTRLMPGTGELPLRQLLAVLRNGGCTAPIGVEMFGEAIEGRSAKEIAELSHSALVSVLP
jgi:sugar phosphate isomerase/epimerase